jgi:phage terminase large subunit
MSATMAEVELPKWARRLRQPAPLKGIHGGRGSAKSHSIAQTLVLMATERPLRILCAREIQKSIKESVKALLDAKIEAAGLTGFYQSLETEIRGANGSLFTFAGLRSNIASVKSMEGIDICWVEEAQSISQNSLDVLIPTVRGDNSEIWFSWNPDLETDPVDKLLRSDETPPGALVIEVNFDQNPWFPANLIAKMEWDRKRDPEKYQHVWRGAYKRNSEARVFKNWRVEECAPPADTVFHYGADWGFSVDPSVLVRAWLEGRTLYIDQEAYAVGCPIDHLPALFAGSDTKDPPRWPNPSAYPGVPGAYRWPIIADSARPETIAYMKDRGFDIQAAIKGAGSVEDGVEFLQSVDIVVHPRCQNVIDELTFYSWKVDKHTKLVLPILADKDNHTIDALRYALEGVRRGAGSTDFAAEMPRSSVEMWQVASRGQVSTTGRGPMWR